MSQAITKIKSRIKSIDGTLKVTSAMKLVSTVKLKRYRNKMMDIRSFSNEIDKITGLVLSNVEKVESPFVKLNNKTNKRLYVIVSSTLGLCGAYNQNIFKVAEANISSDDDAIILGKKGISHFQNGEFTYVNNFENYSSIDDSKIINEIVKYIEDEYVKQTYKEIHLIYSEYKNSIVFKPRDFILLPLKTPEKKYGYSPILEPTPKKLISELIPLYIKTSITAKLMESEVCEQAARCNAMENATDNANELLNNLKIEFNKARQASITQEIIEVVGASKGI